MENQVNSIGLEGMRGYHILAEANVREDKEACVIIGLPDATMKESKERILSCLHTLDIDVSMKKITIHLSPADQRKTGTGHDCAMLVAVLQELSEEYIPLAPHTCFLAALSLSGDLVPFHGMIPSIQQALKLGYKQIIIPPIDISFIQESSQPFFIQMESIEELQSYLKGQQQMTIPITNLIDINQPEVNIKEASHSVDFSHIRGHKEAKRVLEIAAAGGHHVLFHGPPGCGKSMLADAFHTIFPNLSQAQTLEIYSIYELAKERRNLSHIPPYRRPHHSASAISLIGGGTFPKPGEISLAHDGILFLDELGEFPKKALDMLRQPMETGEVVISRVRQTVYYPARFTLIAATNPCPCGYYGSNERYCTCTPKQIRHYQLKVSGPLFDRFDFILKLNSVGLMDQYTSETSQMIKERTTIARKMQEKRYQTNRTNATAPFSEILSHSLLTKQQENKLKNVCYENKWSNRTQAKLIRIARTIADLDGNNEVTDEAIDEAIKWKSAAIEFQMNIS